MLPKTKAEWKSKIKKHGGSVVLHSSPSLPSHHSPADAANGFFSNYTFAFTNKLLAWERTKNKCENKGAF